jgi:hypothetical protein
MDGYKILRSFIDPVTFAKKLIKPYLANLITNGGKNKTKKNLKKNKQ